MAWPWTNIPNTKPWSSIPSVAVNTNGAARGSHDIQQGVGNGRLRSCGDLLFLLHSPRRFYDFSLQKTFPCSSPPAGGGRAVDCMFSMFSVYAIHNRENGKIYIGQTDDLVKRIRLHNDHAFRHSYTSRFSGEWKLIYEESFSTRQEALVREKQLKSFRGREFIRSKVENIPL